MKSEDMIKPFLYRVVKKARRIICDALPTNCTYELYLIGSAARGELTLLFEEDEISFMSDIELYLLTDVPNMEYIIEKVNHELSFIQGISVEVNGTTFQRFKRYTPKQWLVDAAHCSRLVESSNVVAENSFIRYYRSEIPRENFVTLLLNRIIEYEKESDFYFLVKLYVDVIGVMFSEIEQYTVLVEKRLNLLSEKSIQEKLKERYPLPREFINDALIVLGYKLYPSKAVGIFLESKRGKLERCVYEVVKKVLLKLLSVEGGAESVALLYQKYLSKRGILFTLKEWIQDSTVAPLKSFVLALKQGLRISPRSWVFYSAAQRVDSSEEKSDSQELYQNWVTFCKSA